jgi:hypothetical protein
MENAQSIRQRMTTMAKMFFSLGFWMTMVLFVGLGYVFGADLPDWMDHGRAAQASAVSWSPDQQSSVQQYQDQNPGDDSRSDFPVRPGCPPDATLHNQSMFPQVANWQRGGSMYAPGLSITISDGPQGSSDGPQASLCPGPVEIPQNPQD